MVVALRPQTDPIDDSWRLPGCGPACRRVYAFILGEGAKKRLEIHDPRTHEMSAENACAEQDGLQAHGVVATGLLRVDHDASAAFVDGQKARLTITEWRVIRYLAMRLGAVCPNGETLRAVWGPAYAYRLQDGWSASPEAHLLRVNVARIRSKLGPAGALISTVPGFGYILRDEPPTESGGTP
jgi:DNA-binding response OmpR family regulator